MDDLSNFQHFLKLEHVFAGITIVILLGTLLYERTRSRGLDLDSKSWNAYESDHNCFHDDYKDR